MKKVITALISLVSFEANAEMLTLDPIEILTVQRTCAKLNLYHEARGEGEEGLAAVLAVMIARVKSKHFPNTLCDVVWQDVQFEWTQNGRTDNVVEASEWRRVSDFVDSYFSGEVQIEENDNILFYHAGQRTRFFKTLEYSHKIGNHKFYRIATK